MPRLYLNAIYVQLNYLRPIYYCLRLRVSRHRFQPYCIDLKLVNFGLQVRQHLLKKKNLADYRAHQQPL